MFRRNPGSTAAAFIALAVGIAATSGVFSLLDAALIRPLPVKNPDELVRVFESEARLQHDTVSLADYLDWKRYLKCFAGLAAYRLDIANLTGNGLPVRVRILEVETNLLPLLGVEPVRGRGFVAEGNQPGRQDAAIVSWRFWRAHYGGGEIVGKKIFLDGKPFKVVGVLPEDFDVLGDEDFWTAAQFDPASPTNGRGVHSYMVLGRLRRGASIAQANAELRNMAGSLAAQFPKENAGVGATAITLRESISGDMRPTLLVLFAAVGCLLLIACSNVANLQLTRASERRREMSVRIALGASRVRIFSQLMTESALLSVGSGIAGVGLAWAAVRVFRSMPSLRLPRAQELALDWRVVLFTALLVAGCALFFGLAPAWSSARVPLGESLKQASARQTESGNHQLIRKMLVCAQATLATLLSIQSILFLESFLKLSSVDPGFHATQILTMYLALPRAPYEQKGRVGNFSTLLLDRIRSLPGVVDAAVTSNLPLAGSLGGGPLWVKGESTAPNTWATPFVQYTSVSPDYFRTMQIPVLQGRVFDERDRPNTPHVAIANNELVRRYFKNESAIGRRVEEGDETTGTNEIVGVVGDVRQRALEQTALPELYFSITQVEERWIALVVRTDQRPARYLNPIRQKIREIDPNLAIYNPRTMEDVKRTVLAGRALDSSVLGGFAVAALLLATLGTYSVTAFFVVGSSTTIALHTAFGAKRVDILRFVTKRAAVPGLLGIAFGLVLSVWCTRLMSGLLFGVGAFDAGAYTLVLLLQIAIIALATLIPARFAMRVEPAEALRYE